MIDRRRALLLAPFGLVVAAGFGFRMVLSRMESGRFDPKEVPSQLMGKPAPPFRLPGLGSFQGFGSEDLVGQPAPVLINFFASWCQPCIIEHPSLMALSKAGLAIWGIAYKDAPAAAIGFLDKRGNPFARVAEDRPGQVAIDWGVYGVPESYLVDRTGHVRWRMAGPITPEVASEQLTPLVRALT